METIELSPSRNGHDEPGEVAPEVLKEAVAKTLSEQVREDSERRVAACIEELAAVLKKHNCALGPEIIIDGKPLLPSVRAKPIA